jgi:hypothetical protein
MTRTSMCRSSRAKGGGGLGDLVEEERSAAGLFDEPGAVPIGAGVGTAYAPQELGLQQRLGQGGAVEGDEGAGVPSAVPVDRLGDEFLSGSTLALHQDVGVRVRDASDLAP